MAKIKCSGLISCKCERCIEEDARRRKRMSDDIMDALVLDQDMDDDRYEAAQDAS